MNLEGPVQSTSDSEYADSIGGAVVSTRGWIWARTGTIGVAMLPIDWPRTLSAAASHSMVASVLFIGFVLRAIALPAVWSADKERRRDMRKVLRILIGREGSKKIGRKRHRR